MSERPFTRLNLYGCYLMFGAFAVAVTLVLVAGIVSLAGGDVHRIGNWRLWATLGVLTLIGELAAFGVRVWLRMAAFPFLGTTIGALIVVLIRAAH